MEALTRTHDQTGNVVSDFFVDVPQNVLGGATPPLYDGFRALFVHTTSVTLAEDGTRTRVVSERIRNCAARMLCFINFCLKGSNAPQEGLKYSRPEFQELFRNEYSLDIIEVAQDLLLSAGFVSAPCQDGTTERAFRWKINGARLREAFETVATTHAYKRVKKRRASSKHAHLTLLSSPENVLTSSSQEKGASTVAPNVLSHAQASPHGRGDVIVPTQGHLAKDAPMALSARSDTAACLRKIPKSEEENCKDTLLPPLKLEDEGGEKGIPKMEVQVDEPTHHVAMQTPLRPEAVVEAFADAPHTPETVLAFFDTLRGYRLTGNALCLAQEKAQELCFGNIETQRSGYSLLAIMLTTVYLLKHDPKWQENFEKYCGRTGIPEVWSVNKWIGGKWPLAKRRSLSSSEYVLTDDGTLLSGANYHAMIRREREEWRAEQKRQQENVAQTQTSFVAANEYDEETKRAGCETEAVLPVVLPPKQEPNDVVEKEPTGWTHTAIVHWHVKRLRESVPPYFTVDVQAVDEEGRHEIVIKNACLEDDVEVLLRCNKDVGEFLKAVREARSYEEQEVGWHEAAVAQWWAKSLEEKLPLGQGVEVCFRDDRYVIEVSQSGKETERIVLVTTAQCEALLLTHAAKKGEAKKSRRGLRH